MKVGYAVLYTDGTLVISKNHSLLKRKIIKDYGEFEDINVPWKKESEQIENVQILDQVKANCMNAWFEDCINLIILINFKDFDTSDCTDFSYMFYNCVSLQDLNELQNLDVSNGIYFSNMFYNCKSLQNLNGLQNWNVSNGIYFPNMFAFCKSLQEIYITNTLDILTKEMFYDCNSNLKIHWKKHDYTYADLIEYGKIC